MSDSQHAFVVSHYAPRAESYLTSVVHSSGADLDQIESVVRGRSAARVLDLGCGGGHVSHRVAPHVAQVVACDLTPAMVESVRAAAAKRGLSNIDVRCASAEALPFEPASFDIVLCRFSVHHWKDWEQGLREARRVLKPGGTAVFSDVISPAHPLLDTHLQAIELLRDPSHVRNYSAAEWIAALGRAGLQPNGLTMRKLRMDFPVWIARTRTPPVASEAILWLQTHASAPVRDHFAIGEDGSFDLDTLVIEAASASADL